MFRFLVCERRKLEIMSRFDSDGAYLRRLRTEYRLEETIASRKSDYEKVQAISRWVRSRWEHNGLNEPRQTDAISILEEAAEGKRFRCVEYSIVLSAALISIGIPARVLNLKTVDADTRESGAGHVVADAYLADRKKWIMVDGQFDVIPTLNKKPLNAVEFQKAIAENNRKFSVDSFSNVKTEDYVGWVAPYLYYFGTYLQQPTDAKASRYELILKPTGAKDLTVFQRRFPMNNKIYISSMRMFYEKPL